MFYYLTYEGTVDLDNIDDPLQRKVGPRTHACNTAAHNSAPAFRARGCHARQLPMKHTYQGSAGLASLSTMLAANMHTAFN